MGLDEWRAQIDDTDRQILQLLSQRARLSIEIGQAKRDRGEPVFVPEREQSLLGELCRLNPGPLSSDGVRAIWSEILSASRRLQGPFRVAFLGPAATYSHQAALRYFGESADYVPVRTIPEVILEVERGGAEAAVVPIENSTEGAVNYTLDGLIDTGLTICGEIRLDIHHNLLSRAAALSGIKRVYSHPQALAQCRNWLDRHLPQAEVIETSSTTLAAERAGEDVSAAAVAGELAGRLYRLPALRERIEDVAHNITRFLVMGRPATRPTGRDKTSILLSVAHEVGALHRVMETFATARVNLVKIESRPTRRRPWEYVFFVDFDGHQLDPVIRGVLTAVRERSLFLKVLGSYPVAADGTA